MIASILFITLSAGEHKMAAEKPVVPTISSVSSSRAMGGVTAGMIGSVQQTNVLPTIVRGPLLDAFKERYTIGASLFRRLRTTPQTDEEIEQNCQELDEWYSSTYEWLSRNVSPWAAERFAFAIPGIISWGLSGAHRGEVVEKRSQFINALAPVLQNLDQLMREPSIYPESTAPIQPRR